MQSKAAAQAELKNDGLSGTGERVGDLSPQIGRGTGTRLKRDQAETLFNTIRDLNAGFGEIVANTLYDLRLKYLSLASLEWIVASLLAFSLWAELFKEVSRYWKCNGCGGFLASHVTGVA